MMLVIVLLCTSSAKNMDICEINEDECTNEPPVVRVYKTNDGGDILDEQPIVVYPDIIRTIIRYLSPRVKEYDLSCLEKNKRWYIDRYIVDFCSFLKVCKGIYYAVDQEYRELLEARTRSSYHQFFGRTPLMNAVTMNDRDLFSTCLEKNPSNVNAVDDIGFSGYVYAQIYARKEMMDVLNTYRSDEDVSRDTKAWEFFIKKGVGCFIFDNYAMSEDYVLDLLSYNYKRWKTTLSLVSAQNDINDCANYLNRNNPNYAIALFLLASGVDADHQVLGGTALFSCCHMGITSSVEFLLASGANPNVQAEYRNRTPLIMACTEGHYGCAYLLLTAGASFSLNVQNSDGDTALIKAVLSGNNDLIKLLLEYDADVDIKNNKGENALLYACSRKDFDTIALLVKHGADVTVTDNVGRTPLRRLLWRINLHGGHDSFDVDQDEYETICDGMHALLDTCMDTSDKDVKLTELFSYLNEYCCVSNVEQSSSDC